MPVEPDENGHADVAPSLPDGTYHARLVGMGIKPAEILIGLLQGVDSFFDVEPVLGDLTSDGQIGLGDLAIELANFGR